MWPDQRFGGVCYSAAVGDKQTFGGRGQNGASDPNRIPDIGDTAW
jgi:hypothetical protein